MKQPLKKNVCMDCMDNLEDHYQFFSILSPLSPLPSPPPSPSVKEIYIGNNLHTREVGDVLKSQRLHQWFRLLFSIFDIDHEVAEFLWLISVSSKRYMVYGCTSRFLVVCTKQEKEEIKQAFLLFLGLFNRNRKKKENVYCYI